MRIESINKQASMTFEFVQSEEGPLPAIIFSIAIQDNGYDGENREAWFSLSDVAAFQSALAQLHFLRKGTASLESMSPQECKLTIQSVNRKGDFVMEYLLSKHVYLEHTSATRSVSGAFDMNPSDLERFAKFLSAFVSEESL
ncbi:hypothetical protein FHS16_006348 [Paenibacillus endophyticus]|uniref:Uncharacterized protein n=1 Tax=Paenibacillus endophyticus TaxID=1294268 RepID=A0A7W5CEJ8_9BACL|nr:hypothetical protein [Paenibacillus endophyticus]MBB3156226.1 hypothetical protein [Paenibacillus endophyticus]